MIRWISSRHFTFNAAQGETFWKLKWWILKLCLWGSRLCFKVFALSLWWYNVKAGLQKIKIFPYLNIDEILWTFNLLAVMKGHALHKRKKRVYYIFFRVYSCICAYTCYLYIRVTWNKKSEEKQYKWKQANRPRTRSAQSTWTRPVSSTRIASSTSPRTAAAWSRWSKRVDTCGIDRQVRKTHAG